MKPEEKRKTIESYEKAKAKGVPFFPDALFKDAVISLVIFLILAALAYFVGAPLEERANPADTSYTPRPEWYFLFLFQLLKYFPGQLEVIGVVIIPTIAVLVLLLLPILDRSGRRFWRSRPIVAGLAAAGMLGIGALTVLSILEAPPPAQASGGDPVAQLYTANCSGCHGSSISVAAGTNLHEIIAEGRHEGMPAWSADLTTDQIDALAGFVLSPTGSSLFFENCGACHEAPELVAGDPAELRRVLNEGADYPPHAGLELPAWQESLDTRDRISLLNFLAAPDGQRLFVTNCSSCHGQSVAFAGDEEALKEIIAQGGMHLEMPAWQTRLSSSELYTLAAYVVDPQAAPVGASLFNQHCAVCHGDRIPFAESVQEAQKIIVAGGGHETMPVWGSILTEEQLDALTAYTFSVVGGAPLQIGGELFSKNCAPCHGEFGEGGPNPARAGDVIAPISSAEYLKTRDDATLRAIIAQGQPNFGMSPFGNAFGGPLDEQEIDSIVTFLRAWEANPPVELPPEFASTPISVGGAEIYAEVCAQCHDPDGATPVGPSLSDPAFQASMTDEQIFDTINLGHEATAMISWGEILSSDQISQLVDHIRSLGEAPPSTGGTPSFSRDVQPILRASCASCHGSFGGWDAATYEAVINSGNNGPAVIPGDAARSFLAQKLLGTQTIGAVMPPAGALPRDRIQVILDWIAAGAQDN